MANLLVLTTYLLYFVNFVFKSSLKFETKLKVQNALSLNYHFVDSKVVFIFTRVGYATF